jgi:hypothetical protein
VTETLLIFAMIFFILSLLGVKAALGKDAGMVSPFEASRIFPRPTGILYPGLPEAAGVNPAALAMGKKITAIQGAYTPSLQSGDPQEFFAALGSSQQNVGFGFGYDGVKPSGGSMRNGIFAGAGVALPSVSFGVDLRDPDLSGGFSPDVDLGLKVGRDEGLSFGAVLYQLNSPAQLNVGIGYAKKSFNLEGNVLLPPFSGGGNGYTLTGALTVFASNLVSLHFRTSYFTAGKSFSTTVGASVGISSSASLLAQYTTDRTLTAALTFFL